MRRTILLREFATILHRVYYTAIILASNGIDCIHVPSIGYAKRYKLTFETKSCLYFAKFEKKRHVLDVRNFTSLLENQSGRFILDSRSLMVDFVFLHFSPSTQKFENKNWHW